MGPSVVGGMFGLLNTGLNQTLAGRQTDRDRQQNYMYNEWSAAAADARTRKLYSDIYSPQALMEQYKAAGLSPSMMFGGTPGQGGQGGAQGNGSSGLQTPYMPMSLLEGAQAANLIAQTKKTNAETKNVEQDTIIKELQTEWQKMENSLNKTTFTLLNTGFEMPDGTIRSYYDIAGEHKDFDKFIEACRNAAIQAGEQETIAALSSEQGSRTMRSIFMSRQQFNHDISILSEEKISADFQKSIIKAMQHEDFENWNAKAAISYLQATVQTQQLDKSQKEAWNNLLQKLKDKNSTMADIVIVLGMIVNQAMTSWHMPNFTTHNTNNTTNVFNKR